MISSARELHAEMVSWLRSQGFERLLLTTEPGTRAERFYKAGGWIDVGHPDSGEIRSGFSRPASGLKRLAVEEAE